MSLGFGTSGVRGLVVELTDFECALYTKAFLRHLKSRHMQGEAASNPKVLSISGDFRSSTPRILRAVAFATLSEGWSVDFCGRIPTPALALHAMRRRQPSLMVTGSHIPDDRNGIKFNLPTGEILKEDEKGISAAYLTLKEAVPPDFASSFEPDGSLKASSVPDLGEGHAEAIACYRARYLDFFPANFLRGRRIVLFEHSAVGREVLLELLTGFGAEVVRVGRSETFIPVDTEAVQNPEQLARWVRDAKADALITADGDSDRPLLVDELGNVVRGDVLGILVADFLRADAVAAPVSCNTALEKSRRFPKVLRTKIGSPFVIAAMNEAISEGCRRVVGYEANGGFLLATDLEGEDGRAGLVALPTRDAVLPLFAALYQALRAEGPGALSALVAKLPQRFTHSGLLRQFPTEHGKAILGWIAKASPMDHYRELAASFGNLVDLDFTDGARMTFDTTVVVHFRPSGNAPEFRCYTEASSIDEAAKANERALKVLRESLLPVVLAALAAKSGGAPPQSK